MSDIDELRRMPGAHHAEPAYGTSPLEAAVPAVSAAIAFQRDAAAPWALPVESTPEQEKPTGPNGMAYGEALFWTFVHLRHEAWRMRHVFKAPQPWSPDPVIQTARFTNVYRALDRGTQYLVCEVYERLADQPRVASVYAGMVYRFFNRIGTYEAVKAFVHAGPPVTDRMDGMRAVLTRMRSSNEPVFTGAYMSVSCPAVTGDRVSDMVATVVQCWNAASSVTAYVDGSANPNLRGLYDRVLQVPGFGDFLSYMCATDLCFPVLARGRQGVAPCSVDSWAKAGPGAKKGLAIVCGGKVAAKQELPEMLRLWRGQHRAFADLGIQFGFVEDHQGRRVQLSLLDVEHSLCEFQKYMRVTGGGHVKTRFSVLPASAWRPPCLTLPALEADK